eukprot:SM002549S09126  [mRNA]  locus=s2549:197:1449:- [translate_table: standard]
MLRHDQPCNNPECLYLHDAGVQEDSFTKEQMLAKSGSKHQVFHDMTHPALPRRVGGAAGGFPPPLDLVQAAASPQVPAATQPVVESLDGCGIQPGQAAPAMAAAAAALASSSIAWSGSPPRPGGGGGGRGGGSSINGRASGLPPAASWGAKNAAATRPVAEVPLLAQGPAGSASELPHGPLPIGSRA